MTEVNFSSGNVQDSSQMNFMLPPPPMMISMPEFSVFSVPEMPMFPVPALGQKFDHEMLSGNMPREHKNREWERNRMGQKKPCRLDEDDVKTLLK